MEPKQNYLHVGIFVVTIIVAMICFVIWLAGFDQRDYTTYHTYVSDSVNGLGRGSAVKYRGVDVGKVTIIRISKSDPSKIHIIMDIDTDTPITEGTVAILQLQGITGISYIELKNVQPGKPRLDKNSDSDAMLLIPSAQSEFRQIVDTVPAMLQKFTELANQFKGFASPENQQKFSEILVNLQNFSQGVGATDANGKTLAQELHEAVTSINDIATNSREDTKKILKTTAATLEKIGKLTDNTGKVTQQSAADLQQLLVEVKKTARDLQALSGELKDNPSKIVIPNQPGGVTVK
jgi:phospholipid/cholesterol/gamma-HCH transport system substrate-binding protein